MFTKKNLSKRILAIALVVWLLAQSMGSYIPVFAGGLGSGEDSGVVSGNGDVPADMQTYNAEGMAVEDANTVDAAESMADETVNTADTAENTVYEAESMATDGAVGDMDVAPYADGASQYDLSDYLTAITLANASGELDSNAMIGVRLNFKVPAVIPEDNQFIYNFGDIKAYDEDGNTNGNPAFDLASFGMTTGKVMLDGEEVGTYQLNAATGELIIKYDIEALGPSDVDRTAYFQVSCRLNEDAFDDDGGDYELKFTTTPGVSNPNVTIKESPNNNQNIVASKSHSELDIQNRTVTYTITLENKGDQPVENLVIHDAFSPIGNANNNTFHFEGLTSGADKVTVQDSQNGFKDFVISSLPVGTTSFSYTCSFDASLLDGTNNGGAYVNNEITVKQKGDDRPVIINPDREGTVVNHPLEIRKDIVNKRGRYNAATDTITWTITINSGSEEYDIAGLSLKDILSNDSGIVQEIQDKNNIWVVSKSDSSKRYQVTVTDDGGFDFTFPTNEGKITDEFQIVYTTKAEFAGTQSFKNKVTAEKDGEKLDEAEVSVGATHTILDKTAVDYSENQPYIIEQGDGGEVVTMKWTATVAIPENATGKLIFTDKLESLAWKGLDYDYVLNGNQAAVNVSLDDGTSVTSGFTEVTSRDSQWDHHFQLTFDEAFVTANQGKTVVITYETTANMKGEISQTFQNTAHVELGTIKQDDKAERTIKKEGSYVNKGVNVDGIATVNEKEHMITWRIAFNTWETEQANWEDDVAFTDKVSNMKFYGIKTSNQDIKNYVYVTTNNGQTYKIPITGTPIHEEKEGGGYTEEFSFRLKDAEGIRTYGGSLTDYIKDGGSIYIYYTTYVPTDELEKYNNVKDYQNEATLTGTKLGLGSPIPPQTVTEEGEMAQKVLSKECTTASGAKGNILTYSIAVNPDGLKLSKPEYSKYRVVDTLPEKLIYKNGSLKVRNSKTRQLLSEGTGAGQYEFSMDEENHMILMVPDQTPLVLTYEVYMLADEEETFDYRNSVVIPEPYVENESYSEANSSKKLIAASSGVNGAVFNIEKVNGNDLSEHLPGARFEAAEYKWNGSAWTPSGVVFEGITDTDGMLSTSNVSTGNAEDHAGSFVVKQGNPALNQAGNPIFQNNCYYVIKETVAPVGYAPTTKTYKVVISAYGDDGLSEAAKNALPADVYLVTSGIPYLFTNIPRNSLTIHKTYWDAVTEGNTTTDVQQDTLFGANAAEIKIYAGYHSVAACQNGLADDLLIPGATGGNGEPLVGSYTANTTNEKNKGDGNTYTLSDIKAGTYTVYESRPAKGYKLPEDSDGNERVYYFTVDTDGTVRWDNAVTGTANAVGEIRNYRAENNFTINKRYLDWNGTLLTDTEDLEKAVFYIQQTKNGAGAATPTAAKTELTAKEDGTYETGDLEPGEYVITEKASDIYEGNENLAITLKVDDARNITCSVLPADKQEGAITGNGTTEVSATINNRMKNPVNKVIVEKTYTDPEGNSITTGLSALAAATVFELYQDDGSGNFVKVTGADKQISLKVTGNKVSGEIENLPPGSYRISEKSAPAQYTPAEDVSFTVNGDYTITYDGNKAVEHTIEIENRGFEGDSCLIQINKRYLDQEGNPVNSSYSTNFVYSANLNDIKGVTAVNGSLPSGVFRLTTPSGKISPIKGVDGESYTYYFKEISNQEGYQLTEGYLGITLTYSEVGGWEMDAGNGVKYYDKDGAEVASLEGVTATFDAGNPGAAEPASVSITWNNEANANKLTLTKKYEGPDGTPIAASSLATPASFTLERKSGSTWAEVPGKVDATNAGAGTDGTYVIENLNRGDYRLVEASLPGYKEQPDVYFTVGEDYKITDAYVLKAGVREPVSFVETADGWEYTYSITNVKESNSFTLTKRFLNYKGDVRNDSDSIGLDDLEFTVTGTLAAGNATYQDTMKPTATSGQYDISNLEDGTYTITETGTPSGYIPAGGQIRLVVTDGKIQASYRNGTTGDFTLIGTNNALQVSAYLNNHPADNRITVNKRYMAADGITEVPLANITTHAEFSLYKANSAGGQYTKQGSLTRNGAAYTVENLEPGYYRIQEEPLTGYTPDKEYIAFTVNANYGIVLAGSPDQTGTMTADAGTVTNARVGNSFYIIKTYKDNRGTTVTNNAAGTPLVEETEFSLYRDSLNGTPAGQLTYSTERNRFEITNLDTGDWYISETTTPSGFEAASPIKLTVKDDGSITAAYQGTDGLWKAAASANNGLTVGGTLENHALGNQITVTKQYYDGATLVAPGTLTAWAQFKLYRDYGLASQADVTSSCMTAGSGGRSGVYTFKNMTPGSYTLVEEPMEEFYPAVAGNITFTVGSDNKITTTSTALTQVPDKEGYQWTATVRNNKRHNQISLTKEYYDFADNLITDLSTVENYAQFKLYKVAANGKETEITGKMTSTAAAGAYTIKDIPSGTYRIKENVTGYQAVPDIEFTVDADWNITFQSTGADVTADNGGNDTERELTVANHALNGIRIHKTFYDKEGNAMRGTAIFKLWKVQDGAGFAKGDAVITDASQSGCNVSAVQKQLTGDKNGNYSVRDLPEGIYVITEEKNPVYATPYDGWYLYFEVNADKKVCNVEGCFADGGIDGDANGEHPMMGSIRYLIDNENAAPEGVSESMMAEASVSNYRLIDENQFILDKRYYDEWGQEIIDRDTLIEQTEFVLKNGDGKEVPLTYDKETGKYSVTDLLEGVYTLTEVKAPKGFVLAAQIMVTVDADAKLHISYTGTAADCNIEGNNSLDGLVTLINRKEPPDPEEPQEGEKPEDPPKPSPPNQPPTPPQPAIPTSAVKTGDDTPLKTMIATALLTLILGAGCIGLYLRRRKSR
ncbi:MAG: isopeptide-forming domain-containing fimbrial protein [Lachnospiraceae bacterium]|nr:isopeptide-forming domain-containing fimbrial protein [Lachnospiraceae bacterium]